METCPSHPNPPKTSKTANPPGAVARPGVPAEAAKALAEIEPLLTALSPEDFVPINTDIPRAVSIAVGALPHIAELRADAAKLPDFDIDSVDRLGTYALAAWYAHLLCLPETAQDEVAALLEEAKPLREDVLQSAELLARKGHLDTQAVKGIRAGQGNIDTASDLVALAALFTAAWSRIEHKTTVAWPDVEKAAQLGPRILVALGARDLPSSVKPRTAPPPPIAARAFTLFTRAYDQCRRAVTCLRWNHGDADDIAPSLFAHRTGRQSAAKAQGGGKP